MEICDFLKSWKRMCNSMTEMNGCEDCQIVRNTHGARCGDMPCEMQDVESIAREVEKWAAEHPEPVYPTWGEWLMEQMVIAERMRPKYNYTNGEHTDELERTGEYIAIDSEMKKQIPADIAEKLGIEPKEG